MAAHCRRIRIRRGWAIQSADGRAIPWSSKAPATTTEHGSISVGHPHTEALTIAFDAELLADTELLESVHNENEKSIQHFVVTDEDRRKSRTVVTVAPSVLSSYVGEYDFVDLEGRHKRSASGCQLRAANPVS
jgi:hypothetical protein